MIILIMGLPGSGKTTLAKKLIPMFNAVWLNADKVRKK
jgi:predicted kinase